MHFRKLERTDLPQLNSAFNLAFDNYFVEMQMNLEEFEQRFLKKEKIDFAASGAYINDEKEIVAFIMHAVKEQNGQKVAYNAGTGVIPSARGQRLSISLYKDILENLKKMGIRHVLLEVITENTPAIKAYEKIGFEISRTLDFFGMDETPESTLRVTVNQIEWQDGIQYADFSDYKPSWPCDPQNFSRIKDKLTCLGVVDNGQLKGYAITNTKSGRIFFLGVHKDFRHQGIGSALFTKIAQTSKPPPSILNVPRDAKGFHLFLKKMGMEVKISQFEMNYFC